MGNAGTVIVVHSNVRKRLAVDNFIEMFSMEAPATDAAGLPIITINGTLKALDRALALSDAQTVIIPGHGPVSNKEGLVAYTNRLQTINDRIQKNDCCQVNTRTNTGYRTNKGF